MRKRIGRMPGQANEGSDAGVSDVLIGVVKRKVASVLSKKLPDGKSYGSSRSVKGSTLEALGIVLASVAAMMKGEASWDALLTAVQDPVVWSMVVVAIGRLLHGLGIRKAVGASGPAAPVKQGGLLLALLVASQFAFGLQPGDYAIVHDGIPIDTLATTPHGSLSFEGGAGRWDLVGTVPIPPDECPDLVIAEGDVAADPPCCADQPWNAIFSVRNQGTAAAGSFFVRVSLAPPGGAAAIKCEYPVASLPVGATAGPFTCRLASSVPTSPLGDWTVTICADQGRTVCEFNEANNCW